MPSSMHDDDDDDREFNNTLLVSQMKINPKSPNTLRDNMAQFEADTGSKMRELVKQKLLRRSLDVNGQGNRESNEMQY